MMHRNAHDAAFRESRGISVFSSTLGVSGQCDVLEYHRGTAGISIRGKEDICPCLDGVNAMQSFSYSLLRHDCAYALEGVGLDLMWGFCTQTVPAEPPGAGSDGGTAALHGRPLCVDDD